MEGRIDILDTYVLLKTPCIALGSGLCLAHATDLSKLYPHSHYLPALEQDTRSGSAACQIQHHGCITRHYFPPMQVIVDYAKAFKRRVPHSSLEIVEGGGHHAYWVCDKEMQRLAISRLIKSGLPG